MWSFFGIPSTWQALQLIAKRLQADRLLNGIVSCLYRPGINSLLSFNLFSRYALSHDLEVVIFLNFPGGKPPDPVIARFARVSFIHFQIANAVS